MKKAFFIIVITVILIFFSLLISAQQNRWQLISQNDNGSHSYLDISEQQLSGNRKQTWTKEIYTDGSYKITRASWLCQEKKFRVLDSTNYAASGEYLSREGTSEWVSVVPDSVGENYFKFLCAGISDDPHPPTPRGKIIAQVITVRANIRESFFMVSPVIRQAARGDRFFLADEEPVGTWYQIYLPENNQTGWIDGNAIKLMKIKSAVGTIQPKSGSGKKRVRSTSLGDFK